MEGKEQADDAISCYHGDCKICFVCESHTLLCWRHWPRAANGEDADMADGMERVTVPWVGIVQNKSFISHTFQADSYTGCWPE